MSPNIQQWERRLPRNPILDSVNGAQIPNEIAALLENNFPLEAEETSKVKHFRQERQRQLQSIQHEVERLEKLIEEYQMRCSELEAQLDPCRKEIFACEVALSPARRLHIDIVQEICLHCLPERPSGHTKDAPLSLSQVSSSWRHAVLSLPRIWSVLHIHLAAGFRLPNISHFMTEYFSRAADHPLTLRLSLHRPRRLIAGSNTTESYQDMLEWIFLRWHLISNVKDLTLVSELSWQDIMPIYDHQVDFAQLETIVFKGPGINESEEDGMPFLRTMLIRAPELKKFVIADSFLDSYPIRLAVPWRKLTDLYLEQVISAQNWIALLDECASLKRGHFNISDSFLDSAQVTLDAHKQLEDLSIVFDSSSERTFECLRRMAFPFLSSLRLQFRDDCFPDEMNASFCLQSSMPNLVSLSLRLDSTYEFPYGMLFSDNPSLKELHISADLREAKNLFAILTQRKDSEDRILPCLSRLTVALPPRVTGKPLLRLTKGRGRPLLEMLRSRITIASGNHGLSRCRVIVNIDVSFAEELFTKLGRLRAKGLVCEVESFSDHALASPPFCLNYWRE